MIDNNVENEIDTRSIEKKDEQKKETKPMWIRRVEIDVDDSEVEEDGKEIHREKWEW